MGVRSHSFKVPKHDFGIIFCTILAALPSHQTVEISLPSLVLCRRWQSIPHTLFVLPPFPFAPPLLTTPQGHHHHCGIAQERSHFWLSQSLPLSRDSQAIAHLVGSWHLANTTWLTLNEAPASRQLLLLGCCRELLVLKVSFFCLKFRYSWLLGSRMSTYYSDFSQSFCFSALSFPFFSFYACFSALFLMRDREQEKLRKC